MRLWRVTLAVVLLLSAAAPATAEVRRVVVSAREPVLGGDYEKLAGTLELELDPTHPANAVTSGSGRNAWQIIKHDLRLELREHAAARH